MKEFKNAYDLMNILKRINTLTNFISELIYGNRVSLNLTIDEAPMQTLNELLAKKEETPSTEEETAPETPDTPEDIESKTIDDLVTPSEDPTNPNPDPDTELIIEGKLGADYDIDNAPSTEIELLWERLVTRASGLVAMYPDYNLSAYDATSYIFMSREYLRYLEYLAMLNHVYLDLEKFVMSKHNTNDSIKFILKGREALMKATNTILLAKEIIDEHLGDELSISDIFETDVQHWMDEEYEIIAETCDMSNRDMYDILQEMIQLLHKYCDLVSKLVQMKFDNPKTARLSGTYKMLSDCLDECRNLCKYYIDDRNLWLK